MNQVQSANEWNNTIRFVKRIQYDVPQVICWFMGIAHLQILISFNFTGPKL